MPSHGLVAIRCYFFGPPLKYIHDASFFSSCLPLPQLTHSPRRAAALKELKPEVEQDAIRAEARSLEEGLLSTAASEVCSRRYLMLLCCLDLVYF